jgi:SAM-dependent methyltransferase
MLPRRFKAQTKAQSRREGMSIGENAPGARGSSRATGVAQNVPIIELEGIMSTATTRRDHRCEAEYDFGHAQREWSAPPFDNIGYISSAEALDMPDEQLRELVTRCEANRYSTDIADGIGRNHQNLWRSELGLDSTTGKRIMDFGSGMGIESLQFARTGNRVIPADIVPENVQLASRVLRLSGFEPDATVNVRGETPFFDLAGSIDIFYSNGVLHHTPRIRDILARAREVLSPGGEARLMLYSDKGWKHFVPGPLPAIDEPVTEHAGFAKFVRAFDSVGAYADWYSREKIAWLMRGLFRVEKYSYITKREWYCAVTLRPE